MALDYNTLSAALNLKLEDDIASSINRATVALNLLPIKKADGKNIAWDVRFGTSTGAAVADGGTISSFNVDTKVTASLPYCTYYDAFQVFGRAAAAAANSGGPAALENLYAEEALNSAERLAQALNSDLYTGTGATSEPNTIAGMTSVALTGSGTYATLASGTYSQWAANVLANSGVGRDLSVQLMNDTRKQVYIASGKRSDLILCDPNQFERYANLVNQQRRWVDEIKIRGELIKLDLGFNMLTFGGIPVIEDKDCPAGKMIFLYTPDVWLRILPDETEALMGGTGGELEIGGTDEDQFGSMKRLRARIQPLAVNGDVRNLQTLLYIGLQFKRLNSQGVLADLNS